MSDIFDELQQDMEQERWKQVWAKYRNHVYGGVFVILVATLAHVLYENYKRSVLNKLSEKYIVGTSLVAAKADSSLSVFENIATEGNNVYTTLARFWASTLLFERGEDENGTNIYDTIMSKNSGLFSWWKKPEVLLKEMATFKKAYALLDQNDTQKVRDLVEPFAKDDNPWRFSAYEILALAALKDNKLDEAQSYAQKILDSKDSSANLRGRAEIIKGTIRL